MRFFLKAIQIVAIASTILAVVVLVVVILVLLDALAAYLVSKIAPFPRFQSAILCAVMSIILAIIFFTMRVFDDQYNLFEKGMSPDDLKYGLKEHSSRKKVKRVNMNDIRSNKRDVK